jgi:hypothetical protein
MYRSKGVYQSGYLVEAGVLALLGTLTGTRSGSEARLVVTMRGVVTTTLMVTQVTTPIPSVPLGLLRVSLRCSCGLLCCLHTPPHECEVVL